MEKLNQIEITCIECGHKFNRYQGSMEERTCTTCILKVEDPDVIKSSPNIMDCDACYVEDIDQQAFAQGRESSNAISNGK